MKLLERHTLLSWTNGRILGAFFEFRNFLLSPTIREKEASSKGREGGRKDDRRKKKTKKGLMMDEEESYPAKWVLLFARPFGGFALR